MTVTLSNQTLDSLPSSVARPGYHRSMVTPGIVHVGVGNFHRAHQALYLDDLLSMGRDHDWGIVGAGVRPPDAVMRERLQGQNWLSTIVELEPGKNHARLVGSMVDFVPVASDNGPLIKRLSQPDIRIVSMTVTEGGYYIDPASGAFDSEHLDMIADADNPHRPGSVFGALIAALGRRRRAGLKPFTIMSCDNLPDNGAVARQTVLGLAEMMNSPDRDWIADEVAFPCSMVDRITPATTERERQFVSDRFGLDDAAPVLCEPFRQWVLEDRFPAGRPALEDVGVTLTDQVAAYELMKIRILNGGHAAIAYPAALMDIHFVHDAMANPLIREFLIKLEQTEIIPIVPPVPNTNLDDYLQLIVDRFSNPDVGDTVSRLCLDGSNRQPKFILPSTRDRLGKGQSIAGLSLVSALWCRYCAATCDSGQTIEIDDINAERLTKHALAARDDPLAFLAMTDIFGDVAESEAFQAAFSRHLSDLWRDGTTAVLERYLDGG